MRELSKKHPTLKDLDWKRLHAAGVMMEESVKHALLQTIQRDVDVLKSYKIMDYSLLLAVHNIDRQITEDARAKHQKRKVRCGYGVGVGVGVGCGWVWVWVISIIAPLCAGIGGPPWLAHAHGALAPFPFFGARLVPWLMWF